MRYFQFLPWEGDGSFQERPILVLHLWYELTFDPVVVYISHLVPARQGIIYGQFLYIERKLWPLRKLYGGCLYIKTFAIFLAISAEFSPHIHS